MNVNNTSTGEDVRVLSMQGDNDKSERGPKRPLQEWGDVPYEVKVAASQRYGQKVDLSVAREDGSYRGEVINLETYMLQKVSSKSVVIHPKRNLEYVTDSIRWLDANKRLNGSDLQIHYKGTIGKVYPYDEQRDDVERFIKTLKKTAISMQLPDAELFNQQLDTVGDFMWLQIREKRNLQKPGLDESNKGNQA